MNYDKCAVWDEDMSDIDWYTDKLIAEGLTEEEHKELRFLRVLNGLGDEQYGVLFRSSKDVYRGVNQLGGIQGEREMDEKEKEKLERVRIKPFSELLDAFFKEREQGRCKKKNEL